MKKRTILGALMLIVGLVSATTVEGMLIGLPLVALGVYTALPVGLKARVPPGPVLSLR